MESWRVSVAAAVLWRLHPVGSSSTDSSGESPDSREAKAGAAKRSRGFIISGAHATGVWPCEGSEIGWMVLDGDGV